MYRLSPERRTQIVHALVEGTSVSATARQTGVSKVTILKLLADIGPVCRDYQRAAFVGLTDIRWQLDETWSFIHCKEKRVPRDEKGRGRGDVWVWTALGEESKVIPCWHIGARDAEAARLFVEDLASRLATRVTISTDGHKPYLRAIEGAFGWNGADYAMLVKIYGAPIEDSHRYSPPECIGVQKIWVMGRPDMDRVSTSFVEAQNMTMRQNVKRLARLTNAHSKKIANHEHALSLWFMYYNFCRKHTTLTKRAGGVHTTPAMAAGVADHVWRLSEVVALLAARE